VPADLIPVDANPVADIRIRRDPGRLPALLKGGRFHKEPLARARANRAAA